ncbi:hypothetical protein RIF29_27070 [Crotalaria pallida]|uniref:Uncharacterized protein n=1 Tax=Crotalaria pallida TaxID=3830 RepID=A0AAN9EPC8_CROPI
MSRDYTPGFDLRKWVSSSQVDEMVAIDRKGMATQGQHPSSGSDPANSDSDHGIPFMIFYRSKKEIDQFGNTHLRFCCLILLFTNGENNATLT